MTGKHNPSAACSRDIWDCCCELLLCDSCVRGILSYMNYEQSVTLSSESFQRPCMICGRRQNCAMIILQVIWRSVSCCTQWVMLMNLWR